MQTQQQQKPGIITIHKSPIHILCVPDGKTINVVANGEYVLIKQTIPFPVTVIIKDQNQREIGYHRQTIVLLLQAATIIQDENV
tara:strand:- start:372 stop:623 length:252 start_codon:yes stop_codon:yes gene_type:complete